MQLYQLQNTALTEVHENAFKLEREMQAVFEQNLQLLMGLTLVKGEFTIKNKRIDTLAYSAEMNAFVIIEYKRDKNSSVFDQGITYLKLMIENKADFVIEYNERLGKAIKRDDIDWDQSRVAFVSTSFNDNQIQTADFRDFAIDLWEVQRYSNNTLSVNKIKKSKTAESIKAISKQNPDAKILDQIKVYTEDDLLVAGSDETRELYNKFKDGILNLADDIQVIANKQYIAFRKARNIVCMNIQKKQIRMWIGAKAGTLDDAKGIAIDVSNTGHWGTGDYEVNVNSDKDLEYIMSLIKQVL
jgi:predicted transport protein